MNALYHISAHLGSFVLFSLVHHFNTVKPLSKIPPPPPPPLFKGRKLMIPSLLSLPPLPFSFLTNLINQSRLKPLFGLILNDLFTCWNFRLFWILGFMNTNFLCLSLFRLY